MTSSSPPLGLDRILSQAAVSLPQVEQNDALTQVTDQIALETVAVAIPSEYVERIQEELEKIAVDRDGVVSIERSVDLLDDEQRDKVIDLNETVKDFVEAITADTKSIDAQDVLPESISEEILNESGIHVDSLKEPEAATGVAILAQPTESRIAVVGDIISGEAAEAVDIAPADKTIVSSAIVAALPAVVENPKFQKTAVQQDGERTQTLSYIIARHPVWIATGFPTTTEIDESIALLDDLITALKNVEFELYEEGLSPGFETKSSGKAWFRKHVEGVYETLPSINVHTKHGPALPVPSPAAAVRYYQGIRDTWVERKRYMNATGGEGDFCSCIANWAHSKGDILAQLSNQSLEQDMIREASDSVTARLALAQPGSMRGEAFDRLYAPETCPTPESVGHLYIPRTSIRIIAGRDDYIRTFTELALSAENSIDIATCYVFPHDPAQRYILLDLLPYIARTRGVKVRLLCDMMPIESSIMKSVIRKRPAVQPLARSTGPVRTRSGISPTSFVNTLPSEAPVFSTYSRMAPPSPMAFLQMLLQTAYSIHDNCFEIKWWCARDSQEKYRIKNHAKCAVFDSKATKGKARGMALMGGSNICPTVESGDSDLDILVGRSDVVNACGETFDFLWDNMCDADTIVCTDLIDSSPPIEEESDEVDNEEEEEAGVFPKQDWLDQDCKVSFIRSEPCSAGSDAIFRHVLGAITSAKESIYMCMGHSNKPMALARALGDAVKRGVRVQLLVNSIYSCDLRVNQRDLFRSIQNLLTIAPGVEVWTTTLRSHKAKMQTQISQQQSPACTSLEEKKADPLLQGAVVTSSTESTVNEVSDAPPFLHSKYTVVDRKWTAVGSWNIWTRSAFYEIEHELLIQSEVVAKTLIEKFEKEKNDTSVLLTTPEECAFWCPTGCKLCTPFGPFYT